MCGPSLCFIYKCKYKYLAKPGRGWKRGGKVGMAGGGA